MRRARGAQVREPGKEGARGAHAEEDPARLDASTQGGGVQLLVETPEPRGEQV